MYVNPKRALLFWLCLTLSPLLLWPGGLVSPCSWINLDECGPAVCLQKKSLLLKRKTVAAGMRGRCTADLLKMAWLIWVTLLNAPSPSVRRFPSASVPRWRTGQGCSTAGEEQERWQTWPWSHGSSAQVVCVSYCVDIWPFYHIQKGRLLL